MPNPITIPPFINGNFKWNEVKSGSQRAISAILNNVAGSKRIYFALRAYSVSKANGVNIHDVGAYVSHEVAFYHKAAASILLQNAKVDEIDIDTRIQFEFSNTTFFWQRTEDGKL